MLTFKQYYKIEANKIKSEYGCTLKEAMECIKLRGIEKEFVLYLEGFKNIPNRIVNTIPFEPRRNYFIKCNIEKITK